MSDYSLNEERIIDYLLGDLPETETGHLDHLSVTNDEFAEFLETVENDLVDDYIRQELPENRRARFESYYLASPERQQKVAIARTLLRRADKAAISHQQSKWSRRAGLASSRASQWSAIAAAFAILAITGYLLLSNIQLRNQIAQMKEEHHALKQREDQLQRDLAHQRSSDHQKEKELALTRERLETLERQLADYDSVATKLFAFTLSPQQRDIAEVPNIKIPAATESLVITLKLESDDFDQYETVLKNPATDEILWRGDPEKGIHHTVVVKIPKKIVKSEDYILELFGIDESGNKEIISGYPFRVLMQ